MGIEHAATFVAMDDDPDDYRPASSWALSVDPDGRSHLSVIRERIGIGDRIPRHWHDVDEVVMYTGGEAVVHLEGTDQRVEPGATVFIPAGAIHGTVNSGSTPVEIIAVFPAIAVRMDLVERNAIPGSESAPPRAVTVDLATGDVVDHGPTDLPSGYRT